MKYYIDSSNTVFAYEEDGSQDGLIGDKTEVTDSELSELRKPTQEELDFIAKQEKLALLKITTVTTSNGNTFDGNDIARQDMLSAIDASATLNITELNWKMADNEWVTIHLSELKEASALAIQAKGAILAGV